MLTVDITYSPLMEVIEKGGICDADLHPCGHRALPSLSSECPLASCCPLYFHSHLSPYSKTLSSHVDYGRTLGHDLTDSCLCAKSCPAHHYQIDLPQTLLSWCNYPPRDLEMVRHREKKKHLASPSIVTLSCQHSPAKRLHQMISELKLSILTPPHLPLLMVFAYLPNLSWPLIQISIHLLL